MRTGLGSGGSRAPSLLTVSDSLAEQRAQHVQRAGPGSRHPGDPALPVLEEIPDEPHRAHRSYIGPDGVRRMDDRPDDTLRTGGLQDVARHLATAAADTTAVAPTVDACDTHGPDSRIDRSYASKQLLPAVRAVEVIDMKGLSDHHTVVVRLDRDTLTDILNNPITRVA